jgi:hypothetical protein
LGEHGLFSYLRYLHGAYNLAVILFVYYHGWVGLNIRRTRRSGNPPPVKFIRRHRRLGPVLASCGILGFFGGWATIYLHEGRFLAHPLHFFNGLIISLLICYTFFVGKKIKAQLGQWRDLHFVVGIMILSLSCIQAFLGISILF